MNSDEKEIKHVAVIIAMEAEAHPFLTSLKLQPVRWKTNVFLPCSAFQGPFGQNGTLTLIINGKDRRFDVDSVGTTPAALAAFLVINDFHPDIILSAGTVGGFKRVGASIGDCFIGSSYVHHDRRIQIPGFDRYGVGLRHAPECKALVKDLGLKSGVVSSGNSLDATDTDHKLMLDLNASVKEMEAAAIAYVADHANIPFLAVKVVTDIVDGDRPSHEEFLENLHKAADALQYQLPRVVAYLIGKKLADL